MRVSDYRTVVYRNPPGGWVAEIPALPGCHALMTTKEAAVRELENVFAMIAEEFAERGGPLPRD
jgi:predicted RNase H-like HicB family nuclease